MPATRRRAARRLPLVAGTLLILVAPGVPDPLVAHATAPVADPTQPSAATLLALADADLRAGREENAHAYLMQVVAGYPGTSWAAWAELGLGFLELARGHLDVARPHFQQACSSDFSEDTASIVLGLLDAHDGKTAQAVALLEGVAARPMRTPAIRQAASLAAAYARYWGGDFEGAAVAFGAAADEHPEGPLADDALYGLGRSFLRLGDSAAADEVLRALAERQAQGAEPSRLRRSLLMDLDFRELLRPSKQRYRNVRPGLVEELLAALLDVDGGALARRTLGTSRAAVRAGTAVAADGHVAALEARVAPGGARLEASMARAGGDDGSPAGTAARAVATSTEHPERGRSLWVWGLLALASLVLVLAIIIRRAAGGGAGRVDGRRTSPRLAD